MAWGSTIDQFVNQILAVHGETITYVPNGGTEREILALVTRGAIGSVPPTNAYPGSPITITVANRITDGISSAELDLGKDNIKVAQRPGMTAASHPVGRLLQCDADILQLEVR